MSLGKIIIIFVIILIFFAAFIFYQFNAKILHQAFHNLPTGTAQIDGRTFQIEIAKTTADQQQGLSGRTSLAADHGMLFIFSKPDYYQFWMKGMKFPLDIIFINNNKIVQIVQNAPAPTSTNENPQVYQPTAQANDVLEINAGLSKKYGFNNGDSVTIK